MSLLKIKELKAVVEHYKQTYAKYEVINKSFAEKVIKLYNERKAALPILKAFHDYVSSLQNNELFMTMLGTAESIKSFEALVAKEEAGEKCDFFTDAASTTAEGGTASRVAGVAGLAGLATALGGQTALWAAASAFGTTAGGTAIGTLAGAAELNAFLAWLGGGAIAAGGGGVAAGSAIFAAVPIVGWVIAGIGTTIAVASVSHSRSKNQEKIAEVQAAEEKLEALIRQIKAYSETAEKLIGRIIEKRAYLHVGFFDTYPNDCNQFTAEQRSYLTECCNCYVQLCHDINASIA